MLKSLRIKNLALIKQLSLSFTHGFTTLTGETGAGKSILLDALGLVLGNRAENSLISNGAKKSDITAEFDLSNLLHIQEWLRTNNIENDTDESYCIVRRTISTEAPSKSYINGIATSLSQLNELGNKLVDIHGQNEHQSLIKTSQQLKLLDSYAGIQAETNKIARLFKQWQNLQNLLTHEQNQQKEQIDKISFLEFQLAEFQEVSPQPNEFSELSIEQTALSHAKDILESGEIAYQSLEGNEQNNAIKNINIAISALENLVKYHPKLEKQLLYLSNILIDIQESATDIRYLTRDVELDPENLLTIEERLSLLHSLAKKHLIEPDKLPEKQQQLQSSLDKIKQNEYILENLKEEIQTVYQEYLSTAQTVSLKRGQSAERLSEAVTTDMQKLGMPQGKFKVSIEQSNTPMTTGLDKIQFLVTANLGQPLQLLKKVASGGEISRISLAIQVATVEVGSLPTLIFDEVDVGISGSIAEIVGKKMQQLGSNRQILAITHLAQVASHGKQHLLISKQSELNVTTTRVQQLSQQERIEELSRMLGGMIITENTRIHAQEMLQHSQIN